MFILDSLLCIQWTVYLHICTIILHITSRHAHIQNIHIYANYSYANYSYSYIYLSLLFCVWRKLPNVVTKDLISQPSVKFWGYLQYYIDYTVHTMYVLYVGQIYSMRHLPPGEARKKEAHTDYWPMIHTANVDLCVDKF